LDEIGYQNYTTLKTDRIVTSHVPHDCRTVPSKITESQPCHMSCLPILHTQLAMCRRRVL